MSKYKEAETKIKKIMCEELDRLPSHYDGEDEVYDSTKDVDEILELNKTICEALRVADILEQVSKLGVVCRPQKYGSKTEAFAEGYKQALSDIRGDTE